MSTWSDEILRQLREKEEDLQRQLDGVRVAIRGMEEGFDSPPLEIPEVLRRDRPRERPRSMCEDPDELVIPLVPRMPFT